MKGLNCRQCGNVMTALSDKSQIRCVNCGRAVRIPDKQTMLTQGEQAL